MALALSVWRGGEAQYRGTDNWCLCRPETAVVNESHRSGDSLVSGLNVSGGFRNQAGGRQSAVTFSVNLAAITTFRIVWPRFHSSDDIPDGHAESEQRLIVNLGQRR